MNLINLYLSAAYRSAAMIATTTAIMKPKLTTIEPLGAFFGSTLIFSKLRVKSFFTSVLDFLVDARVVAFAEGVASGSGVTNNTKENKNQYIRSDANSIESLTELFSLWSRVSGALAQGSILENFCFCFFFLCTFFTKENSLQLNCFNQ